MTGVKAERKRIAFGWNSDEKGVAIEEKSRRRFLKVNLQLGMVAWVRDGCIDEVETGNLFPMDKVVEVLVWAHLIRRFME